MKPLKLSIHAFGPYKNSTTIDFRELEGNNLFLITGATGSGKTTIFDAICYGLYGAASGQYRSEKNVRCQSASDELLTSVSFEFLLKDKVYKVERSPKQLKKKKRGEGYTEVGTSATLTLPDADEPITGAKAVTESIESLMGLKVEQFRQIMMIPQGEFRKLLMAKSDDRSSILKNIFNTHLYGAIQSQIKDEKKALESSIEKVLEARDEDINRIQIDLVSEEGQLLQKMIEDEHRNISEIIKCVERQNEIEHQRIHQMTKEKEEQKLSLEKIIRDKTQAEINNKNIEMLMGYREKLKTLETTASDIQSKKKLLESIKVSEKILPLYKTYLDTQSELEKIIEKNKLYNASLQLLKEQQKEIQNRYQLTHSPDFEKQLNHLTLQLNDYKKYVKQWEALKDVEQSYDILINENNRQSKAFEKYKSEKEKLESSIKTINHFLDTHKDLTLSKVLTSKKIDEVSGYLDQTVLFQEKYNQKKQTEKLFDNGLLTLEQKRKEKNEAHLKYKEMKHFYHINQAAILAQELEKNAPCPVCGSKEHVHLAEFSGQEISIEQLELEEKKFNNLSHQVLNQESEINGLKIKQEDIETHLETLSKILIDVAGDDFDQHTILSLEHVKELTKTLEGQLLLAQEEIKNLDNLSEKYESMQAKSVKQLKELEKIQGQLDILSIESKSLEKKLQEKKVEIDFLSNQIPENIENMTITDVIAQTEQDITSRKKQQQSDSEALQLSENDILKKTTQIDALKTHIEELKLKIEAVKEDYTNQLSKECMLEIEFLDLIERLSESQNLQMAIDAYKQDIHGTKQSISNLESTIVHSEKQNIEAFDTKINAINQEEKLLSEALSTAKNRLSTNEVQIKIINEKSNKIADKEGQYQLIGHLSDILNGKNSKNLSFERFILSKYLEEIIDVANLKLLYMTNNRFTLQISDTIEDARSGAGLDLEVIDSFTGMPRSVKTLSGGESFKASLSMALGLAEVVQSYAGGIQLDTIFIDEGFGTLDQESLDSAINCLIDLQESGRLVGIISHVQELKERIKTQLIISQTSNGSICKFVV